MLMVIGMNRLPNTTQQGGAGLDLAAAPDRLVLDSQLIEVEIGWQTGQKRQEFVGVG
jgi:hypothetical protein